jgi:hypothetical protein
MRGGLPPDGGDDTAMNDDCGHDLDANYRYPSDVDVLGTANDGDGTVFTPALPCPECGAALEVEARSETVVEGDFELPLDDSLYD